MAHICTWPDCELKTNDEEDEYCPPHDELAHAIQQDGEACND